MTDEGRTVLVSRPDGRLLSVWTGGDPAGTAVMFHHGTPSGRLQAVHGAEAAGRQGVRLISFNRPGYGRSSLTPPGLASVGSDALLVADELHVEEFAVLGASGGGPYAVATGLADQGRVRAVGLAAGVGPWRLIGPTDQDDPDLPILALADSGDVGAALDGFRVQGAVAFDAMCAGSDETMVEAFFADTPGGDMGSLDAVAKRRWGADLRDALRTYDGYARDNVSWGGDWDIDPAALLVRTWLWYGDEDVLVPPSHGHWLAERIPSSTLVQRPGMGHLDTIFGFWDDMLGMLRDQVVLGRR